MEKLIGFEKFWRSYPRKNNIAAARGAWRRLSPSYDLQQVILTAVENQKKPGGILAIDPVNGDKYIPFAASWLSHKRWLETTEPIPTVDVHMTTQEIDENDPRLIAIFEQFKQ